MSYENVTLTAAGQAFAGWHEVTVRAAVNEAVRSFNVRVSEVGPPGEPIGPWHFPPNTAISLDASGDLLVGGFIDDYQPGFDANQHAVTIIGRGRGLDYVDCSIVHPTGRFENKTRFQIAQELARPLGVTIKAEADTGPPVSHAQVRKGDTPHLFMLRLLEEVKLTMRGDPDGSIAICKGGGGGSGRLIQGENILAAQGHLSARDRFSDYIVDGQSSVATNAKSLRFRGEAKDGSIGRYRPKRFQHQAEADQRRVQDRADGERARAVGFSVRANITSVGWRTSGVTGALWVPGSTVFVWSPFLKIEQDMLIEAVEWHQDDQTGSTSTLSVVDPQTYGGAASSVSGSGEEWGY